jgi:osmotically-inducible protein OsmY
MGGHDLDHDEGSNRRVGRRHAARRHLSRAVAGSRWIRLSSGVPLPAAGVDWHRCQSRAATTYRKRWIYRHRGEPGSSVSGQQSTHPYAVEEGADVAIAVAHQTDEDIQREVLLELKWDARIAPNEIGVAVKNGVATLTGDVDAFSKKWAAERAALRVRGVKGVANEIEVRLSPPDHRTDSEMAEVVRTAETDAENITVSTEGSKVILSGTVRSWSERREAERVAWLAPGVTEVENRIRLQP